jgi:RND family efflux transporter MFP subunit
MTNRLLAALPLILGLAGCDSRRAASTDRAPAKPESAVPVSAALASRQRWTSTYEAAGTVRARTSAVISARLMASIREVKVQTGDVVREGQSLIALDARDVDASARRAQALREQVKGSLPEREGAVVAAKANLDLAQATFQRMQDLFEKKSISNQEFDESTARLKAARAAWDMATSRRAQINAELAQAEEEVHSTAISRSHADIRAPFDGIVTARLAEPGNLSVPGAPLLTIERAGSFRLEASVAESRIAGIRLGQQVPVRLDSMERTISGRVSEVVPAGDAASRSFLVKIDLPFVQGLRSGLFGRAAFALGERELVSVPATALIERGQLQSVFVVDDSIARARLITAGERKDDQIEILSGLNAGETVVSSHSIPLHDGSRVEVRR